MRIVTFNVQHARTPAGAVATAALARWCAGLAADVLALQEVDVRARRSARADQAAAVAEATGMACAFGPARRLGWCGRYGNALLVRGDLEAVETVPLPRSGRRERRAALLAVASVAGSSVSVASTHLSVHRDESLPQLAFVLDALRARPRPRLLLGDLNLRPAEVEAALDGSGFTLADSAGPTYPAHGPMVRIDHVVVERLEVAATSVLPRAPVSDHRPLLVTAIP